MNYFKRIALWVDFGINAVRGGMPGEPISAWVFRKDYKKSVAVINFIFRDKNHCKDTYQAMKDGKYVPAEYKE